MGNDFNLAIALLAYLYRIAQIPYTIVHFDFVVEELFERGNIEDLV